MNTDDEVAALIDQAARNLKTLELLLGVAKHSTLEEMRLRIQRLREAYTAETDALTRQVLRRAIDRRRGAERRMHLQPPTRSAEGQA